MFLVNPRHLYNTWKKVKKTHTCIYMYHVSPDVAPLISMGPCNNRFSENSTKMRVLLHTLQQNDLWMIVGAPSDTVVVMSS